MCIRVVILDKMIERLQKVIDHEEGTGVEGPPYSRKELIIDVQTLAIMLRTLQKEVRKW